MVAAVPVNGELVSDAVAQWINQKPMTPTVVDWRSGCEEWMVMASKQLCSGVLLVDAVAMMVFNNTS